MRNASSVRLSCYFLWILLFSCSILSYVVTSDEQSLVVSKNSTLQLSPGLPVNNSPGSKPGSTMICERVQIYGISRLKHLNKIAHSAKVKVSLTNSTRRISNADICFHRNVTVAIGMCPPGKWEKISNGLWVRSMSPFDHKLLDIRTTGSSLEKVEVLIEEEFYLYRIVFLTMGIVLLMLASSLSNSLVFYYSSAMSVGVILVILIILFQVMKILPTGGKNPLAILAYSFTVGLGTFLLSFFPQLLESVLVEMGISEDMYKPLAIFMLVFLALIGAWMGFWTVRKLVLTEDGCIDISTSHFVAWSIRIVAAVMIIQSSMDPILAAGALLCGVCVSTVLRKVTRSRLLRHLYKNILRVVKGNDRRSRISDSSLYEDSHDEYNLNIRSPEINNDIRYRSNVRSPVPYNSPVQGSSRTPPSHSSGSDTFYSSYHVTPERRRFSKEEWNKFTKDSTKKALKGLVSSPDFSKWAVANADRITLTTNNDTSANQHRRWWKL